MAATVYEGKLAKPTMSIVTFQGWVASPSQVTRSIREIMYDVLQQDGEGELFFYFVSI